MASKSCQVLFHGGVSSTPRSALRPLALHGGHAGVANAANAFTSFLDVSDGSIDNGDGGGSSEGCGGGGGSPAASPSAILSPGSSFFHTPAARLSSASRQTPSGNSVRRLSGLGYGVSFPAETPQTIRQLGRGGDDWAREAAENLPEPVHYARTETGTPQIIRQLGRGGDDWTQEAEENLPQRELHLGATPGSWQGLHLGPDKGR